MNMVRLVLFLVCCGGCFLAASPPRAFGADASDAIVYSYFSNVGPLNPHLYSPNQMFAQEMVYEPLVRLGDDGLIEPCLAERWDVSEDGLVYTFHLRPGVTFADGEPFDARAVALNFEHVMANRGRHAWLEITNRIEGFEVVGPLTFRLTLNSPYYPALEDLSLPRPFRFLSPASFPDAGITRDGIKSPVGTGPWKLVRTRLGEYDLFERNDRYWGDPARTARVLVKVVPDPMSRILALQTDEIDLVMGQGLLGYDVFHGLGKNPAFVTAVSNPVGTVAVAVNTNRFPTDDRAVRLAIQHMTDKDALIRGVFMGTQPRADTLFSPDVPYCDIGLEPYSHDPALAAEELERAGWTLTPGSSVRTKDGGRLEIDFCFVGNDAAQKAVAEVLQGQAARVGMRLNLLGEEEDSFYRRQKDGMFGMIFNSTWGPPFEPHAMLGSMRRPSHADYQAQAGLPMKSDIDAAITGALQTMDRDERARLYREILTTLHEQAVYLPIHHAALLSAYRKGRLSGVRFGPGKSRIPFELFGKDE